MLEKKLLTLGCAVGILACGACFLPPPRASLAPGIDFSGSRRILVKVTNDSATRHIDQVVFGQLIAKEMNDEKPRSAPKATAEGEPQQDDAVLQISIAKESTGSDTSAYTPTGDTNSFVQLTINASLARPDRVVLWRETNEIYRSSRQENWAEVADPWHSAGFSFWLRYYVGVRLVSHALFGARW